MLDMANPALFFAASWILIITPGPDMLYVITRGISQGRKAGIISALGVTLGILVHTVFAALGLAMILRTSAIAFLFVKYLGAFYLTYLGQNDLNRVFNPFEQVDNSASRNYQGTGLGLALTKKLVELHGGEIWAQSNGEGQGSVFRFIIPT